MKKLAIATSLLTAIILSGCKARRDGSELRSEDDIQPGQIQWVGTENKWAITCREGRLHNGKRSALVSTSDLRTACEQVDPSAGGGGGGNNPGGPGGGGNTGPVAGGSWDVEQKCPNRPEQVKKLSIAIGPGWAAELSAQSPQVAVQQLCVGFLGKLNQVMTSSPNLFKALSGQESGSPVLILTDKVGTAVLYEDSAFMLTIPWKIDDAVMDKIAEQMSSANINLCAPGRRVLGVCWFKTKDMNENCNDACVRNTKIYDSRTATIAGYPNGKIDNCKAVATEFGEGMNGSNQGNCNGGSGCVFIPGTAHYCVSGDTNATATGGQVYAGGWNNAQRYCACK